MIRALASMPGGRLAAAIQCGRRVSHGMKGFTQSRFGKKTNSAMSECRVARVLRLLKLLLNAL